MLQLLPGGPNEGPTIADALARRAAAHAAAARLARLCVPRPSPPQYLALQQEVAAFASGLGRPQRLLALAAALSAAAAAGAAAPPAALQEADMWLSSAGGWAARMCGQHSAYADICQPVALAVSEACHGLALMRAAAAAAGSGGSGSAGGAAELAPLTAGLLSFPTPTARSAALLTAAGAMAPGSVLPPAELADSGLQAATADLVRAHTQQLRGVGSGGGAGGAPAVAGRAVEVAAYTWQLQSMRAALHAAVDEALIDGGGALGGANGSGSSGGSGGGNSALGRALALFDGFLQAWRQLKEYEAKVAEEKEQVYKTKSKAISSTHMTEEVSGRGHGRQGSGEAAEQRSCGFALGWDSDQSSNRLSLP
jgi:hypothetical protein